MKQYRIYRLTGISSPDLMQTKSMDLLEILKEHKNIFSEQYPTTDEFYTNVRFCLAADLLSMEEVSKQIENGIVIVPFSKRYHVDDLQNYFNLGLDVRFMRIKDFTSFKQDYSDSMSQCLEDKRTKELF